MSSWHEMDAAAETLAVTTAGAWAPGDRINLERSLRIGDELGGHMVSGHVDGVATLVCAPRFRRHGAFRHRGAESSGPIHRRERLRRAGWNLVDRQQGGRQSLHHPADPAHAGGHGIWGGRKAGDRINLEVDTMARYAARLVEAAAE